MLGDFTEKDLAYAVLGAATEGHWILAVRGIDQGLLDVLSGQEKA